MIHVFLIAGIIPEFKIPRQGNDRTGKNGEPVTLDIVTLGLEKNGIGIPSPGEIVYVQHPEGMRKLADFQVSFHVDGHIDPEIIRDPVFVPVRIIHVFLPVNLKGRNGIGDRPSGMVDDVGGETEPAV